MVGAEGKTLQKCRTNLNSDLQDQTDRTNNLESILFNIQLTVSTIEQSLNCFASAHEDLFHTIQHLNTQICELRPFFAQQISDLTQDIRDNINTLRTNFSDQSTNLPNYSTISSTPLAPSFRPSLPHPQPYPIIIVQPSQATPYFSGHPHERPRLFLLQVTQYAEFSFGWNKDVLFQNIAGFLRDTALEWYTQIISSRKPPHNWDNFQTLFLQQFWSALRIAQTEHQWNQCVQNPNESINDFLVRLRSLWSEYKPNESEQDLVHHLFTKIRHELVPLIGVLPNPTLDAFLARACEAELVEFTRSKFMFTSDSTPSPSHTYLIESTASVDNSNHSHVKNRQRTHPKIAGWRAIRFP